MAFALPNDPLNWLQNGEDVDGGVSGDSTGAMNRPLVELLANDTYFLGRMNASHNYQGFTTSAGQTIFTLTLLTYLPFTGSLITVLNGCVQYHAYWDQNADGVTITYNNAAVFSLDIGMHVEFISTKPAV